MSGHYEDIDEALAEYDDESDDEALFGRRRRRRRPRRGYASGGAARGAVSQSQWMRSMDQVGDDVQDTAAAIRKLQADQQNFAQMSLLMPLLLKGKTADVKDVNATTVRVPVQGDNLMAMMLPMMMLGQSSTGGASTGGNNNMMMMLMMMMVLQEKDRPAIT